MIKGALKSFPPARRNPHGDVNASRNICTSTFTPRDIFAAVVVVVDDVLE
jgi:hypothetical protein